MEIKDTTEQKTEAGRLLRLVGQAQILSNRINQLRFYQRANGQKHIHLLTSTHERAVRRSKVFWNYVNENLSDLSF